MSDKQPSVGFAGLGIMGQGMARNFLAKGYPLTVWNRDRARTAALAADGAQVADSPRALAAGVDVVVTCLANPGAVRAVALGEDGLLAGARAGLRWIDTSTIGSVAALELAAAAAARQVRYLEAPVTGSKVGARDGSLVVMTGGPRELHDELAPVIGAFAAKVQYIGPWGTAAVVKLVGNTIISFMLERCSAPAPASRSRRSSPSCRRRASRPRTGRSRAAPWRAATSRRTSRSTSCTRTRG